MSDILVSIITVCYNSQQTIEDTVISVLNQTYDNIEYIIIDGGSTDNTLSIVRKYETAFKGRLRIVSEADNGIYDAMNKGIRLSNGKLVGIINSDDYYETNAVQIMVEHMRTEPYQILYGETRCLRDGIEDSVSIYSHHFLARRTISHPSCFITRALYEKYGGYDLQYSSAADYDFFLRMNQKTDVVFVPVYELIANFRTGGMSASYEAWMDLLRLQKNHGLISEREYCKLIWKDKLYRLLHRKRL